MNDYSSNNEVPWNSYISSIKSVTIENGVTSIGDWAFPCCKALASITIPGSVQEIGIGAFNGCSGLTSVNYLGTRRPLTGSIFKGCDKLEVVKVPNAYKGKDFADRPIAYASEIEVEECRI